MQPVHVAFADCVYAFCDPARSLCCSIPLDASLDPREARPGRTWCRRLRCRSHDRSTGKVRAFRLAHWQCTDGL